MRADHVDNFKIGLDYSLENPYGYRDTFSFQDQLTRIKPGFCVLKSEPDRAITESVITSIVNESCEPIIHFHLPIKKKPREYEIEAIIKAYGKWGVKRVIFFDQPNLISNWGSEGWVQSDLINRFLDRFIYVSQLSLENGLIPIFPPLNPLGNYPDLIFFRQCLENLMIRNPEIFHVIELSVLAWTHNHDLDWGAGGEDLLPVSFAPRGKESTDDHKCFRTFERYDQICQAIIQKSLPIHLLQAGLVTNQDSNPLWEDFDVVNKIINLSRTPLSVSDCNALPISDCVHSCNLVLPPSDHPLMIPTIHSLVTTQSQKDVPLHNLPIDQSQEFAPQKKSINLYVLLPCYDWGVSDWHLEAIKTFVKNHKPAVGFSLEEAKLAKQVLVINDQGFFEAEQMEDLRSCDCLVEELNQCGTSIATILAAR